MIAYGTTKPYQFILIMNNLKVGLQVNRAKNKDVLNKVVRMIGKFKAISGQKKRQNQEMGQENNLCKDRMLTQTLLIYHF